VRGEFFVEVSLRGAEPESIPRQRFFLTIRKGHVELGK